MSSKLRELHQLQLEDIVKEEPLKKDLNDLGMFYACPNTKFLHLYHLDGYNSPGGARKR